MNLEIDYNSGLVKWLFNGKYYEYEVYGIQTAEVTNQNIIFMQIYDSGKFEARYVSLNGNDLLWYYSTGLLYLFNPINKTRKELTIDDLKDVRINENDIFVMTSTKLMIMSFDGMIRTKISPPFGYSFYRFLDESQLSVVCIGSTNNVDAYGRNEWLFKFSNGMWEKISISF